MLGQWVTCFFYSNVCCRLLLPKLPLLNKNRMNLFNYSDISKLRPVKQSFSYAKNSTSALAAYTVYRALSVIVKNVKFIRFTQIQGKSSIANKRAFIPD
jgi:hypothetical protein